MIYYPLSVLMLSGIKDILIISTRDHFPLYENIFGSGKHLDLNIFYKVQEEPSGLADAFIVGDEFIGNDSVCLILGDNVFYGHDLTKKLKTAASLKDGGIVFGYYVDNPNRYGVLEMDNDKNVIGVEEKPTKPKSNYAIPGLYYFDNKCIEYAKNIKPSGEEKLK